MLNLCLAELRRRGAGELLMDTAKKSEKSVDESSANTNETTDASRRQAILKMAGYTAPIMLAMLTSEKAPAASTWKPPVSE